MRERTRILIILLILLGVLSAGTIGYVLIEGWSVADALYMTIITISTVGYSEVHSLSSTGRIFSSILIVCGVGTVFYTFTTMIEYVIGGRLREILGRGRSMENKISKKKNHFIICDYGRVGRVIANRFKAQDIDFVVVDSDSEGITQAEADGCFYIKGDPSIADNLIIAGINKARGIIVVTDNDATNTFIIVTARNIRPDIHIIARASSKESEMKLEMVGANKAMNPYSSIGERMARRALHPAVSDFIEFALPGPGKDRYLEEVEVAEKSTICGKSIDEAQKYSRGVVILAIRKKGKGITPKPSEDMVIGQGDRLVILGTQEQIASVEDIIE
jgi:voltage-gated potassium channel